MGTAWLSMRWKLVEYTLDGEGTIEGHKPVVHEGCVVRDKVSNHLAQEREAPWWRVYTLAGGIHS